jgi:hypothetical protein
MAVRRIQGLSGPLSLQSVSVETGGRRSPNRVFAAFVTGAALFVAGAATLQSGGAGAAAGRSGFFTFLSTALGGPAEVSGTRPVEMPIEPTRARKAAKHNHLAATPLATRRPVCVRLCDGYFFPLAAAAHSSATDEQAACSDQCPDASTALYFLPAGSDKIEDASAASGGRYMALAMALRYRTGHVDACSCHTTIAQTMPYWEDPTLRKGDAVMTANGFMVYRGASGSRLARGNFTRLASAALPRDRRAELSAIERVSVLASRTADRPQIAAVMPSARAGGVNEIRFLSRQASATN